MTLPTICPPPSGLGGRDAPPIALDALSQNARLNRLYTNLSLCFDVSQEERHATISKLKFACKKVRHAFPWSSGEVICSGGRFVIKPFGNTQILELREFSQEASVPSWQILSDSNFPFRLLDETVLSLCPTLATTDARTAVLPAIKIKADFIDGGMLLTFSAQHGAMDMAGLGAFIANFAKACCGNDFTQAEIETGNMDRSLILKTEENGINQGEASCVVSGASTKDAGAPQPSSEISKTSTSTSVPRSVFPSVLWAYSSFSTLSLNRLKAQAYKDLFSGTFISTDDVLSAFVWLSITRIRHTRDPSLGSSPTSLSRNIDMRRFLALPSTYPGMITTSTEHTCNANELVQKSLGLIAVQLRSSLDSGSLVRKISAEARSTLNSNTSSSNSFPTRTKPEIDVRLSSWSKEQICQLDFGFGKPRAVRRPAFQEGAREGLVYFLPKGRDGEIVVGVCLRAEDNERLRKDKEWSEFAEWIG